MMLPMMIYTILPDYQDGILENPVILSKLPL